MGEFKKKQAEAPLISIITATFNSGETIERAMCSLLEQTYPNIEHIVVDGGSSDHTLDVVNRYRHENLKVHSGPDSGIYDALNTGIRLSKGDYFGFLHSDDVFSDSLVIDRIARAAVKSSPDVVYGDLRYVSAARPGRVVRAWNAGEFKKSRLNFGWMPPHPTLYVSRATHEAIGAYDDSYQISGDYDYILRLFSRSSIDVVYIPFSLVDMTIGGMSNGSISSLLLKSAEDLRALRVNGIGGLMTLMSKNVRKIAQFF